MGVEGEERTCLGCSKVDNSGSAAVTPSFSNYSSYSAELIINILVLELWPFSLVLFFNLAAIMPFICADCEFGYILWSRFGFKSVSPVKFI